MKKIFAEAELSIQYWNAPEKEKGETNPFTANDPDQKHNPFMKSAKMPIKEEHLIELLEWFESKGYFTGHLRGLSPDLYPDFEAKK